MPETKFQEFISDPDNFDKNVRQFAHTYIRDTIRPDPNFKNFSDQISKINKLQLEIFGRKPQSASIKGYNFFIYVYIENVGNYRKRP